jgi:8-oxo-dGTP pyrophosphatase MutT (NUDIX family)
MSGFMTVFDQFHRLKFENGGYEGVTVAGLAVVARDTGNVLLAQRAFDETDDPEVRETWEFPGGHLELGEDPLEAAFREFFEEVSVILPDGEVVNGWRAGDEDQYQGFVYLVPEQFNLATAEFDTGEVQDVGWFSLDVFRTMHPDINLRPEVRDFDTSLLKVSGNEDEMDVAAATQVGTAEEYLRVDEDGDELARVSALTEEPPLMNMFDLDPGPIPIHGVLAPEDVESGDGRGFNAGSVTRRKPLRLPFGWQKVMKPGHEGAITVGSIDRMMRKDGLIHWEGSLLNTPEAMEFFDLLTHFGQYGVSIDGDRGGLDAEKTNATGVTWFNAVRIAGATGCAIPAYEEAYAALGPHPEMPRDDTMVASMYDSGDMIGASTFDRGPGWITNPKETKRIHDYWTKPGQPGYEKINWGTGGDYTRCTKLVGEKIAKNSPEDLRFIKRICAQWHHDALGYWPGDLDKPGNDTTEEARAKRKGGFTVEGLDVNEAEHNWEAVLVSSVSGNKHLPPIEYFHRHPNTGATTIEEPDEFGFKRVHGFAAQWGVCHVGMDGRCVEPPRTYSDDYPEFHLGVTKVEGGVIYTGVLTYGVSHRDAEEILAEDPEQAFFDNVNNAWAAVRIGEDEQGIWYSGVVLPGIPDDHLTKIAASGQVSGEWKYGALRACLTVNVPGFPVQRPTASYDEQGNVLALAASAFGGAGDAPCNPSPMERILALKTIDAELRFDKMKSEWIMKQGAV